MRLTSVVNNEFDITGWKITNADKVSDTDLEEALKLVEEWTQPGTPENILKCLAVVDAGCVGRDDQGEDIDARAIAFKRSLTDYPDDVIAASFKAYMQQNKWRPSVAEIREYCHWRYRDRLRLLAEINREILSRKFNAERADA